MRDVLNCLERVYYKRDRRERKTNPKTHSIRQQDIRGLEIFQPHEAGTLQEHSRTYNITHHA